MAVRKKRSRVWGVPHIGLAPLLQHRRGDTTDTRISLQVKQPRPRPGRIIGSQPFGMAVHQGNHVDPVGRAHHFHHVQCMKDLIGQIIVSVHVAKDGHGRRGRRSVDVAKTRSARGMTGAGRGSGIGSAWYAFALRRPVNQFRPETYTAPAVYRFNRAWHRTHVNFSDRTPVDPIWRWLRLKTGHGTAAPYLSGDLDAF